MCDWHLINKTVLFSTIQLFSLYFSWISFCFFYAKDAPLCLYICVLQNTNTQRFFDDLFPHCLPLFECSRTKNISKYMYAVNASTRWLDDAQQQKQKTVQCNYHFTIVSCFLLRVSNFNSFLIHAKHFRTIYCGFTTGQIKCHEMNYILKIDYCRTLMIIVHSRPF